ncbi:MAG: NAD-dependent epimerase/dehydratase family protein [Pirellulales bacterium]
MFPTTEAELEELLSRPTELSLRAMQEMQGDLLVLGVGGKMGASLLRLARRSADEAGRPRQKIIGASRFSKSGLREELQRERIETVPLDFLNEQDRHRLPDAPNVLFMFGHKFGANGLPGIYWAMNTYLPGLLAEQFRQSRIVAFSSGNVYPFTPVDQPPPAEDSACSPVGEYAITAWGRERMLEFVSARHGTPICLLRLNYAVDLRYGVIVDIAQKLRSGEPIDLSVPEVNYCWQGWANAVSLAAFVHAGSPAAVFNVTGTGRHKVRDLAKELGRRLDIDPRFSEPEGTTALVSDASRCHQVFGDPSIGDLELLDYVAAWLRGGGRTLGKPTGFQVRDGKF